MTDRYSRQIMVPKIGPAGQHRIKHAKVLIVGAGGLGCTVASHLAGAGVGQLSIIDHDCVSESNLHRQILFREADIGCSKAGVAAREIKRINSLCNVSAYDQRLSKENVDNLIADIDVVVDAADNFATSYLLSDACLAAGLALICASVNQTFGYVGQFCAGAPSLRAVFPRLAKEQLSCDTVGVTGPSVGVIASLQSQEVLKALVADKAQLKGQLLYLDLWNYSQHTIDFSDNTEPADSVVKLVGPTEVSQDNIVIDVRSVEEVASAPLSFTHLSIAQVVHLPLAEIASSQDRFGNDAKLVCACKSGQRALSAAQQLLDLGYADVSALIPG